MVSCRLSSTLATDVQAVRMLFYRIAWMIREGMPTPYETALVKVMAQLQV